MYVWPSNYLLVDHVNYSGSGNQSRAIKVVLKESVGSIYNTKKEKKQKKKNIKYQSKEKNKPK